MPPRPEQIYNAYGGKLSTRMAHFAVKDIAEPVAIVARDRLIQSIQGTVPKKKRGGAVSHALKSAVENRLVLAINGTIPKSRRGKGLG